MTKEELAGLPGKVRIAIFLAKQALLFGFLAGVGFMAAQDFWWLITGWLSICRG